MYFPAKLLLQTGEVFIGEVPDLQENALNQPVPGEVVFNTGMVGYVESLTDPSYAGQILVFTYPLIGNYGVMSSASWESPKIHAKAVIVSETCAHYSNFAAETSFLSWLSAQNVPCLSGVDTRALTKCLREKGVIPGVLTKDAAVAQFEDFAGTHWVKQVSQTEVQLKGSGEKTIIAIDCGMKENIMRSLLQFPWQVKRVPYDYDFTQEQYDGVFLSNGPGDPTLCTETIAILRKAMQAKKPIFGICLGMQLMALAVGAKTYKLRFGHRSHNQPCLHLSSKKCYLTSQNHGYAVDESSLPADWQVTFKNLNDQSIAGIHHEKLPFFAVQFHPEAAPGPEDTQWLFEKFYFATLNNADKSA